MTAETRKRINRGALGTFAICAASLLLAPAAESDDRDLFRQAAARPYVMVLFDTTGSMADNLAGNDTALEDDDPSSKLFLAKQALDAVLEEVDGVNFGFATFPNQNQHYVDFKNDNGTWITDRNGSGTTQNCVGWEPNNDTASDRSEGYTYKFPTTTNPRGLEVGDILPMDWGSDNVEAIRHRLAPNLALGEATPDYGIARYFEDSDTSGTDYRALRNGAARPFIARGLTPLASTLQTFGNWYQTWRPLAEAGDPALAAGCKRTFVILLTDGFETCGGTPTGQAAPTIAAQLLADNSIRTYVVGFAVDNPALDQIAVAGGTDASPNPDGSLNPGDPEHEAFFAADQAELIDQLNAILREIQRTARSFATAAVPSVVGTAAENAYLTSFSPVNDGASLWPGRIDGWVKPIPTVAVGGAGGSRQVPDRTKRCSGPDDEACLAWDAGEEVLSQAPTQSQVDSGIYKLSNTGFNRRRVYFSRLRRNEEVPGRRRMFRPPGNLNAQKELYGPSGMGFALPVDQNDPLQVAAFVDAGTEVIADTLKIKQALIEKPAPEVGDEIKSFVFGDIFHSDPAVLTDPQRVRYFSADLEGALEACGVSNTDRKRYPCFVKEHSFRRRVLFAGTNDGALHAIDAGLPELDPDNGAVSYTRGSGKELFAFVPRSVLPAVREMSQDSGQQFTVDGPVVIDDVLIDPISEVTDPPDPDEREWRSVLVGGLREGGRAYYALDVTQPDTYDSDTRIPNATSHVPECAGGGADCGPVAYPSILWEFTDEWDEDGAPAGAVEGYRPDLAHTWSKVNTGRIRVMEGADIVDKYVAIFGGGMDADFKARPFDDSGNPRAYSGNFLYMVDIETGKTIYKRRLDLVRTSAPSGDIALDDTTGAFRVPSSAPSEPAAVDTDFDSYIDTIYIGTTGGYLYKVDLSVPEPLKTVTVKNYLVNVNTGSGFTPETHLVERVVAAGWEPFAVYSTHCASGAPCTRPIYYPPSVIFVNELSKFALALGVGDREDINLKNQPEAHFSVLIDQNFSQTTSGLPLDEGDFVHTDRASADEGSCVNDILFTPPPGKQNGWVLDMDADERMLNKPFALAGLVTFTTFIPDTLVTTGGACGADGLSRLYGLRLPCANSLTDDILLEEVNDFVTQPFVDAGHADEGDDPNAQPAYDADLIALHDSLKDQFPAECTFTNYTLDLKVLLSRTGVSTLVPIPVCVIERNWKEF